MTGNIAKLAVADAPYSIDRLYAYLIPENLSGQAVPGMRVKVPFGAGNRISEGVILSLAEDSPREGLKSIDSIIDGSVLLSEENLRLALWMSDRFFCTVYDALRPMLPAGKRAAGSAARSGDKADKQALKRPYFKAAEINKPIVLSDEQQNVFDGISALLKSGKPEAALLYGVTGSGKTPIYIKLIEEALALGRTAIVLVPEIALTPQTMSLFSSYFGESTAVLHSSLRDSERHDEWNRIRGGSVRVVVGTRSAVFAPLSNIGIIILDEEQEHTYKSEQAPRYHAREVAKYRVTRSNALLLLCSATPSVESMYNARTGKYKLFRIENRYKDRALPSVIIADMKQELKSGNGGQISSILRGELEKNINSGEQAILFINRRGTNPIVTCGQCGFIFKCSHCSVSMTYHSVGDRLLCHYCGYSVRLPSGCPDCGAKLKFIGAGTQRVETEILSIFPGISIVRMDADTISRKNSHDKVLSHFQDSGAEILLGTQMVTKGLDFENVTLVGVLSADTSLYMSDYRAHERAFSLITQVVGRSGRGNKPGRAVIQTYTPEHEVICLASRQDYDGFYERELALRISMDSPPICDLLAITATGADEVAVKTACDTIRDRIFVYFRGNKAVKLLGPAPAQVSKVKNKYRYRLLIKCENTREIRATIAHTVREFARDKRGRAVTVFADAEFYD